MSNLMLLRDAAESHNLRGRCLALAYQFVTDYFDPTQPPPIERQKFIDAGFDEHDHTVIKHIISRYQRNPEEMGYLFARQLVSQPTFGALVIQHGGVTSEIPDSAIEQHFPVAIAILVEMNKGNVPVPTP